MSPHRGNQFVVARVRWPVVGVWLVVSALLAIGCGTVRARPTPTPRRVPPGGVAIIGAVPVLLTTFHHWLPIVEKGQTAAGDATRTRGNAKKRTISFLIRAQWLLQEATAEGINKKKLSKVASQQTRREQRAQTSGMTASDVAFQARLDLIAAALQNRHETTFVSASQVGRYYTAHRSLFQNPAVRDTLMVVTHDRASALEAKAMIVSGQRWALVAKRLSSDSSALNGGTYTVVETVQSPSLVRAVFAAKRGQITGPIRAAPAAQPSVSDYYLFKVTGGQSESPESLAQVAGQIRAMLTERNRQLAVAAFIRAFTMRWRARTLCAPRYVVTECRDMGAP